MSVEPAELRQWLAGLAPAWRNVLAEKTELRRYSQDAQSGDLGELSLQPLLPEARSTVLALKPGEVSAVIQSASGFHIIKLKDVTPAHTATENEEALQLAQCYRQDMTGAATLNIDSAALSAIVTAL